LTYRGTGRPRIGKTGHPDNCYNKARRFAMAK
jgi:hypothetical protein